MWRNLIRSVSGAIMLGSVIVWSQEAPPVATFRGGGRLFFKRVEVGPSSVIRLSFNGMAWGDLIVIRSRGREMQIVGGVYRGPQVRNGAVAPKVSLASLVSQLHLHYAPLPEEAIRVSGTQVEFERPATASGVVFFDVSVPEGALVHLMVNGRSILNAQISEPLEFFEGQLGPGPRGVAETMWRAVAPDRREVVPLAIPGEYAVAFRRLTVRQRIQPEVAPGETVRAILAIDENGRVVRALAFVNGRRDARVEERLLQWEFEPFLVEGKAVRVITTLTIQ